jgi:N-acetylglucosaminyldiphosphoundecaprenol N-acetyl-beta-D-mannosaminyltransferase
MNPNVADPSRRHLFGLPLDPLTMGQAVARCAKAIENREQLSIGVVNAAKVVAMRRNAQLREAVGGCGMILADGQAVVWASQLLGSPLPERVAGIDLFMELLDESARRGYRVYFLGARPDVLARMLDEVGRRFPGLIVAGARDGYYQPGREAEIAEEIRTSRTDILFLGMSSPRKELFMGEWGPPTKAHVLHGVGGSFDILAGQTRRAPMWLQTHGLEWLYRAWQEPIRLGRRYLKTNLAFLALVARERIRRRGAPAPEAPGTGAPEPVDPAGTAASAGPAATAAPLAAAAASAVPAGAEAPLAAADAAAPGERA